MKKQAIYFIMVFALLFAVSQAWAGETYFKFEIKSKAELEKITRLISIDNVKDFTVYAYANDRQLIEFEKLDYEITVLPHPGTLITPKMSDTKDGMKEWDSYPSYSTYLSMMNDYETNHPALCEIVNIGSSVEGRDILFAKISDNVGTEEDEPEVLFTSSMHGDELTGYVLMLRLIDSLLTSYGTDSLITRLIDSCEIWINPLANPDGTYAGGNSSVYGATRSNANGVDLNRNYPDPEDGPHPDGNSWQAETIVFMDFAGDHTMVIGQNFHGGAEVLNYPWDTWATRHADDQWWQDICHLYADSAQFYSPSGYLDGFDDGITNGYDWYSISGGRQDYMNYWHGCREITNEISNTKLIPASQLPAHWTYNRVSFLDWTEQTLYGVRGIVTDNSTGLPIIAKIEAIGHDIDSSHIYTDSDVGNYHRMLEAGFYDLKFSAPGYIPHTENNVTITDLYCVRLDIALEPLPNEPVFNFVEYISDAVNPGDTVSMNITLENVGGGNAYNTVGILFTDDSFVTLTQASSSYPTIPAIGGTGTSLSSYEFIISPACTLLHIIDFGLEVTADGGYLDTLEFTFLVGDRIVFFADDFSFDQGWTGMGGSGEWAIGPAVGGSGSDGSGGPDPSVDHSPGTDNYVLGNDLTSGSGGDYNSGLGSTYYTTSPYFDCTNFTGVDLRFYRWLGIESSSYDHAYLQVYNGSSWITIYENGSTLDESSWSEQYYDVSAYADNNPDFQIRFGIGPTDGSAQYCGWNIDDMELKGYGTISGETPDIAYEPTNLDDSLHLGGSSLDTIKTYNNGDALLRVRYTSSDSWLVFNEDQHNIAEGDSLILPVTINTTGLTPGDHIGTINMTSNDPDTPSGSISVNLHIFAPDIAVVESSIEETIESGQQMIHEFVIQNNGPGILSYELSRLMFNGKVTASSTIIPTTEPLGYRAIEPEKGGGEEPFFAGADKSSGGPDAWGYNWIDSDDPEGPTFEWVDISSIGTEVPTMGDDDSTASISIGFDFPFYENTVSSLNIGSNGIITFGGGSIVRTNQTLPTSTAPNNLIAMWWDDLDPRRGGNIYYYSDIANERFIVSFVDIKNYYSTTGTGSLTFQAILYSSGKIILQYSTMDPGSDASGLAGSTVGIENPAGNDGLEVTYNAAYMHDNLAIQFMAANWMSVTPGSGTVDPYSTATIDVGLDATTLSADTYNGQLTISSNDPDTPIIDVPVTLTVEATPEVPLPPALVSPDDDALDLSQPITLVWNSVPTADSFKVQLCVDSLFAVLEDDATIVDTSYQLSTLGEGNQYFWRVRARNDIGWGDWSSTRDFTTEISWVCGDVDLNGSTNVLDITYLINYLYKGGPPPDPSKAGDVNGDYTVNMLDVTYYISYLYKSGPPLNCPE